MGKLLKQRDMSLEELSHQLDQGAMGKVDGTSAEADRRTEVERFHSSALLSVADDVDGELVFRLDFKLEMVSSNATEFIGGRTFVLQQTGEQVKTQLI